MATCTVCGKPMLTEWPHAHESVIDLTDGLLGETPTNEVPHPNQRYEIPLGSMWAVEDIAESSCFNGYSVTGEEMGAMVRVTLVGGPLGVNTPDLDVHLVMSREVADKFAIALIHHGEDCQPE